MKRWARGIILMSAGVFMVSLYALLSGILQWVVGSPRTGVDEVQGFGQLSPLYFIWGGIGFLASGFVLVVAAIRQMKRAQTSPAK